MKCAIASVDDCELLTFTTQSRQLAHMKFDGSRYTFSVYVAVIVVPVVLSVLVIVFVIVATSVECGSTDSVSGGEHT